MIGYNQVMSDSRTLESAYASLDPLREAWSAGYYVRRPDECEVHAALREDGSADDKTILVGMWGSGKTTELRRLAAELGRDHVVMYIDAPQAMNLTDFHYADLLILIGAEVLKAGEDVELSEGFDDLRAWYEERLFQQMGVGEEDSLSQKCKRIGRKIALELPSRALARGQVEGGLAELLESLNSALEALRAWTGKRVLIIVDGLDRAYDPGQLKRAFAQPALLEPACRMVYAAPWFLLYDREFRVASAAFTRCCKLHNVKLYEADGSTYRPGWEMLREVLARRMARDLMCAGAIERLIEYSGGVIRELLILAREAVLLARRERRQVIEADVERVVDRARGSYAVMVTGEDYRALSQVLAGQGQLNEALLSALFMKGLLVGDEGGAMAINPLMRPLVAQYIQHAGVYKSS